VKGEWESFISGCWYREYKTLQRKKAKVPRREKKLEDGGRKRNRERAKYRGREREVEGEAI